MRKLSLLIFTLFVTLSVLGQDILPDNPGGFVNDYAGMLSTSEVARLEYKLSNYRDTTTNVIAIATVESLQGNSIEEVAILTFSKWKLWEGQVGERDNGVLLLISEGDRSFRIEVGYGLEGAIPDAIANRILNDILTPNFREGNFYAGIDRATDAMMQLAAGEFEGFPERRSTSDESGNIPIDVIIFIIVVIFVLISRGRGGKHGGGKRTLSATDVLFWGSVLGGGPRRGGSSSFGGGNSFGGGFGGFGGGGGFGSGGGGASGGW